MTTPQGQKAPDRWTPKAERIGTQRERAAIARLNRARAIAEPGVVIATKVSAEAKAEIDAYAAHLRAETGRKVSTYHVTRMVLEAWAAARSATVGGGAAPNPVSIAV